MPRKGHGLRQALTIRLPFDLYREVALRSKARNWSMSDFVAFCVAKEVSNKYRRTMTTSPDTSAGLAADEWLQRVDG